MVSPASRAGQRLNGVARFARWPEVKWCRPLRALARGYMVSPASHAGQRLYGVTRFARWPEVIWCRPLRVPCSLRATNPQSLRKRKLHGPTTRILAPLDQARLSTAGDKLDHKTPKNLRWTTGTPVVEVMSVAKRNASHSTGSSRQTL